MGNHSVDCDECGWDLRGLSGGHAPGCTVNKATPPHSHKAHPDADEECAFDGCPERVSVSSTMGVCKVHAHKQGCRCSMCKGRLAELPQVKPGFWTVARSSDGRWSVGGPPDHPRYAGMSVWEVPAPTARRARELARSRWGTAKRRERGLS